MQNNMWVVVANASTARIFSKKKGNHKLSLIKELSHPDSRKKGCELISDGPGRFQARGEKLSGNFSRRTDPKKVEADHFAKELAMFLEHGRKLNDFQTVLLVMPAHFQGLVKYHSSPQFQQKICGTMAKDYHAASLHDLESLLS